MVFAGAVCGNEKVYEPADGALKEVDKTAEVVEVAAGAEEETKVLVY